MTSDERVAFFFQPPNAPQEGPFRSRLYLLRREAQDCLIGKVVAEEEVLAEAAVECHRPFATVMVLGAGIDLLAKFQTGRDDRGQVGARFTSFAERYCFVGETDVGELARALYYGVRNPVVHSFGLDSQEYRVILTSGANADPGAVWRSSARPDHFAVSVEGLYAAFVRAVGRYKVELSNDDRLRQNFESMYRKYGKLPFMKGDDLKIIW